MFQPELHTENYWTVQSMIPQKGTAFLYYILEDQIIETNCSFLMRARDIRDNTEKVVKFVKFKNEHKERYLNEVNIMKMIDHPNIIKLEYSSLNLPYLLIVTKYAKYQNLVDYTRDNYPNGMPEYLARKIMKQMLESIDYLHKRNIRHRDIKPQNFLVFQREPNIQVALSDFGFAKEYIFNEKGTEYVGTEAFAPPEIHLHHPYTNSVDIWPLGITLYFLLTCQFAFRNFSGRFALIKKIIRGLLNYKLLQNKGISPNAIKMIRQMCKIKPEARLTAEQLLKQPWMTNEELIVSSENENCFKVH